MNGVQGLGKLYVKIEIVNPFFHRYQEKKKKKLLVFLLSIAKREDAAYPKPKNKRECVSQSYHDIHFFQT